MKYFQQLIWIFFLIGGFATAQNRTITGKVTSSSDKMPLPGASVFVPSKTIANQTEIKGFIQSVGVGEVTDFDGNFSLTIPANTTQIAVSFVGFETKIISLSSNKNFYAVALQEEANALEEVVVTGYQKIEQRKLTSAIVKVETKDILQGGVSSIDQLLQGQVAGMVTSLETGSPGELAKIRIRGTASLTGTQDPLWVVDGLPLEGNQAPNLSDKGSIDELKSYSIGGINPEDIQDITILKDAAATAIYGARAANGVIIVTTKRGKKGSAMRVNFSANTFVSQRPDFARLNLMNSSEKVDFELGLASRTDLYSSSFPYRTNKGEVARILDTFGELATLQSGGFSALSLGTQQALNSLKNQSLAWDKLLYRNTFNKQYTASISGGGEKSDYYFSLGYYDEEGTTVGTGFKRLNVTFNNTYQIGERLNIGVSVLASQSNRKTYITDTDSNTNPSNYSRNVNPYFLPLNSNQGYNYDKDIEGEDGIYTNFNFLEERNNTNYMLKNQSIKAILDIEYKILKGLKYVWQLGVQTENDATEKYAGENSYNNRRFRTKYRYSVPPSGYNSYIPEGGMIQNWNSNYFQYNWKNNLLYNFSVNEKHEFDFLLGSELRRDQKVLIHSKGFGFNEKNLTTKNFNNSSSNINLYQKSDVENAFASFYATGSYTYNHRYTLFGSVRLDGSNLFGVDPKYKYLPMWAASGSWLVSEENFLKNSRILPYLRVRASYGIQGNVDKNTSPFVIGNYGTAKILPDTSQSTLVVTSPPNDKLRWEKTTNYNYGIDAGFLNNRIRLSADIYQRISTDLLGTQSLPLETGFNYSSVNWAQVSNKGYEFMLNTQNIRNENFDWTTTISFSHNQSNVDKMQVRENDYIPSREGLPVNAVFAFKTNGLDENGIPMFVNKEGNSVPLKEFFKLYDPWEAFYPGVMVNTSLTAEQIRGLYTYVGDTDPKFSGGIVNNFRYKNFDVSVSANFNIHQTKVRTAPYHPAQVDRGVNYSREILNAWSPNNTQSSLPRIFNSDTFANAYMEYTWLNSLDTTHSINTIASLDSWVNQMSYLRITNIRLGYTLDKAFTKSFGVESLRFSLEGRNLFVFSTDYSGYFDPETYGNIYAQPISKSVTLGVNVSF